MPARPATTRLASARAFARAVRTASRPGSAGLLTRLAALPRLARAVRTGDYAGASIGQLATLAAAAVYVVSPVDALPEGILGILGLGDDGLVLAFAASALVNLTEDFLTWEKHAPAQPSTSPGYGGTGPTLPGEVIR